MAQGVFKMGAFYRSVVRPILFLQEEEAAHDLGLLAMRMANGGPANWALHTLTRLRNTEPIELMGLKFPTAVGMAAGMDKNGEIWRAAAALGFGHVEIGTITSQKQTGNERPRLFRYPKEEAIINRMGFNNDGAEAVGKRLKVMGAGKSRPCPLGINIGKSRTTPLEKATEDYLESFSELAPYADYFSINVSSPNTPELRRLQGGDFLPSLLGALTDANRARAKRLGQRPIPILVKIAPDLSFREIDEILQAICDTGIDGIIATNTSVQRPGEFRNIEQGGGLSGRPLLPLALKVVNYIHHATEGKLPIIGCGGVSDPRSAGQMMDAGASLVQTYTGFVFGGPFFAAEIAQALSPRQRGWV